MLGRVQLGSQLLRSSVDPALSHEESSSGHVEAPMVRLQGDHSSGVHNSHKNWRTEDLRPVAQEILGDFGPQRLMFGSDWPVCRVAGGWAAWAGAAEELFATCRRQSSTKSFPAPPDAPTPSAEMIAANTDSQESQPGRGDAPH